MKRLPWCAVFCALAVAIARDALAMNFSIVNSGIPVVYGSGPIIDGDAERLRPLLQRVPRDKFGLKHLHLDSPGGSVDAAFKMAEVMDAIGVSTLVPPNAKCASACAAILFVAGRIHLVAPGGWLGLHTCYNSATKVSNEVCNDRIASFALDRGTDYGSVYIFMKAAPADEMIWFSAGEADCFGLNAWPEGMKPASWNACIINAIRRQGCLAGQREMCR